jgi:predicted Holliday junction resolvase-like endonuclease
MASVLIRRQLKKKRGDISSQQYSEAQRMEAVAAYLLLGKWPLVEAATGVPVNRLRHWKMQDWWKELEEEIRRSRNIEVSGKLNRVIDKVFGILEDRVENGDFQFDPKTGKFIRRPIGAKVAGDLLAKTLDREIILQKISEKPKVQDEEQIIDRLKMIEQALLANSKKKLNVIEGELVEDSNK